MTNIKYLWCTNSVATTLQKKLLRNGKWSDNHELIPVSEPQYNYLVSTEYIDKFGPELTVNLKVSTSNNRYCVEASVFHRRGEEMIKVYRRQMRDALMLPALTKLLTFEFSKCVQVGYGIRTSGSIQDCTLDGVPCAPSAQGCLTFARTNLYMQAIQWLPTITKELWEMLPDKVNPNK